MTLQKRITPLAATVLCALGAQADEIITVDGSRLVGTITLIDEGTITLDTGYAGELKIDQEQVASFSTDEPRFVRLINGETLVGVVTESESGSITVENESGTRSASTGAIAATWNPDSEDPEIVRSRRKWSYEVAFDLAGKTGNSEEFGVGLNTSALLEGPDDSLLFYFQYERQEQNGAVSTDRTKAGAGYESFFYKDLGWYARTEGEQNEVNFIDFRSTSAAGLSYRWIDQKKWELTTRGGLGYRYTAYSDGTPDESTPTLDFVLSHMYQFNELFKMHNMVTYTPAIEDFNDYTVLHESSIEMPIGVGDYWFLRMGIRNEYDNMPATAEKLDTTYFTRLVLSWE